MSAPATQPTSRPNPTGRGRWSRLRMQSTPDLLERLHATRERLADRVILGGLDLTELREIDLELDHRRVPPGPESEGSE